MLDLIYKKLSDPQSLVALLAALSVVATIVSLALPVLRRDNLGSRMKNVASEREKLRQRERERLAQRERASLRAEPKAYMKQVVENFNLGKWVGTDTAKKQLAMAGFRGPSAEVTFLFFRMVTPIALTLTVIFYIYIVIELDAAPLLKIGICGLAAYFGLKAPEWYLSNRISKRQLSMRRAFPDAMDLILICVESGMAVEPAFRKVASEIGVQSIELAEEFALTTAELSYLPDRRSAYQNMVARTGIESIKQVSMVLIQAEKYGTPLGQALRVVSQESRDNRLMEAEKKAASLPPKLTVPMIIFFLPVLFAVIMTPAIIQIREKF